MVNENKSLVNIQLISTIRPIDGESETFEMWLNGQLINKADSLYLKYEEMQDEQIIRTTIKLDKERALIMRAGAVTMRLPLHILEQQKGHYESELGLIPLVTQTKNIVLIRQEMRGHFHVQYDLLMDGQSVGNYALDITFTEVQ